MDKKTMIDNYMTKLGISYEEAVQLVEDDENDFIGEEGEEMQKKAKQFQHREKADKSNKKSATPKERKVDADKKTLFDLFKAFSEGLELNNTISNVTFKTETEINFTYNQAIYTWKLTKHRPPKK